MCLLGTATEQQRIEIFIVVTITAEQKKGDHRIIILWMCRGLFLDIRDIAFRCNNEEDMIYRKRESLIFKGVTMN